MAATKGLDKVKKAENETKGRRWGQDPHYPRRLIEMPPKLIGSRPWGPMRRN